jgi:alpha-glucosidase
MAVNSDTPRSWWRDAVIYQIYPLSFADSDGDGFGDLDGVIAHLDYLSDTLGVDAIWLSPFFKSPMEDWGYDIADHTDVEPIFGDLDTAQRLIDQAHERGLRVILDYVINHTSDQHPWFQESRSARDSAKRDWYVWRDPGGDGSPPTNWVSVFGGPMWTLDEATDQYFRHTFLPRQPDLNWRNPEVVDAMLDVARFWLDRGIDGFRVDAAHHMMKDPQERDNPPAPDNYQRPWKDMGEYDEFVHLYDSGHPDVHETHRAFRRVLDGYGSDPVSVGEIHIFDLSEWASYYGEALDQLHMPFNFHLMVTDWDAESLRATIEAVLWNVPVGGWTNWPMGNHDESRMATRLGTEHARLAAMLVLTLRGTPFLYYGDELGMTDVDIPEHARKDSWSADADSAGRDGARTPMLWRPGPTAGFSTNPEAEPWLPISPDANDVNVETQLADPGSMLNLYRRLLELRHDSPALRIGSWLSHPESNEAVLVYSREADRQTMTVALNLSAEQRSVSLGSGEVVLSTTDPGRADDTVNGLSLGPHEGVIVNHR